MGRALVAVAVALGAVWVLRLILGPWAAALVLGPALWAAVVAGWALLERRLDSPPPPPPPPPLPVRRTTGPVVDVPSRG